MTKLAVTFIICFIFVNTGTTELNKTRGQVFERERERIFISNSDAISKNSLLTLFEFVGTN